VRVPVARSTGAPLMPVPPTSIPMTVPDDMANLLTGSGAPSYPASRSP
jgi:hypothetical protein